MKFFIIFLSFLSCAFLTGCGADIFFSGESSDFLDSSEEAKDSKPTEGRISRRRGSEEQNNAGGESLRSMRVRDLITSDSSTESGISPSENSDSPTPEYVQQLHTEVQPPQPKLGAKFSRPVTPSPNGKGRQPQLVGKGSVPQTPPPSQIDRITPPHSQYPYYKNGRVDIVIVQDASNSMDTFWLNAHKYFAHFVDILDSSLNWRMMFTKAVVGFFSSDGRAVQLEKDLSFLPPQAIFRMPPMFLSPDLEDYQRIFLDSMHLHRYYSANDPYHHTPGKCDLRPGCQHHDEQPFSALKKAFGSNDSFFRSDADVAAIIISDGDESEVSAEQVLEFFNSQWGYKRLVGYSVIMVPHSDEECSAEKARTWGGEGGVGVELSRLALLTGGGNYSLCSKNYSNLARQIVDDFKKQ